MIGAEVVRLLCDAEANVKSVSLDDLIADARAESVKADLTDFSVCKDICSGMDYVFHVAGIKGSIHVTQTNPASFFTNILMMNTNMLEAARREGVKKCVYTSSIGAYSSAEVFVESEDDPSKPPMDMFPGWAKRMAEMQVEAYKIQYQLENFAIVRPCNVYGPKDNFDPDNAMVIPSLMSRIAAGENPLKVWGDGSAVRDFAFSTDVAVGVIQAMYYGTRGSYVNLGSGEGVTIKELVETLARVTPFDYEFDASKPAGFPRRVMDLQRAREWINYNPQVSLYEGLQSTWNWYIENKNNSDKRHNYFTEKV